MTHLNILLNIPTDLFKYRLSFSVSRNIRFVTPVFCTMQQTAEMDICFGYEKNMDRIKAIFIVGSSLVAMLPKGLFY